MAERPAPTIAAFDFDGTIIRGDAHLAFLAWRIGFAGFVARVLVAAPGVLAAYLKNGRTGAKEALLSTFLARRRMASVAEEAEKFCAEWLPRMVRPGALAAIARHKAAGDRVIIVTACPELILAAWAKAQGVALVGSRLETAKGQLTGRLDGANCRGAEKLVRLATFVGGAYRLVAAYGDSSGDKELLAAAESAHFRPFRD